jgi:hypothetical protein
MYASSMRTRIATCSMLYYHFTSVAFIYAIIIYDVVIIQT